MRITFMMGLDSLCSVEQYIVYSLLQGHAPLVGVCI